MRPLAPVSLAEMQPLLRGVSRSFYLSIRLLPAPLRRPIALAYLLARAADTIADTPGAPAAQRQRQLSDFAAAVAAAQTDGAAIGDIARRFSEAAVTPAERRLMAALPRCLAWLDTLAGDDQRDIRGVLAHITRGQALDLQRFAGPVGVQALADAGELDEYTYLVAGCVGEFWTDLCLRHVPAFANLAPERMRELGREYGMGLQLVNILRDCGADIAGGRCYLPADEIAAAGLSLTAVRDDPRRLAPVAARWQALARRRMEDGLRYAQAVNSRRIRAASVLPALLGVRTLVLLQAAGADAFTRRVKVPRSEVRTLLAGLALTLAGRSPLAAQFARLQQPAAGQWDNRAP